MVITVLRKRDVCSHIVATCEKMNLRHDSRFHDIYCNSFSLLQAFFVSYMKGDKDVKNIIRQEQTCRMIKSIRSNETRNLLEKNVECMNDFVPTESISKFVLKIVSLRS